MKQSRQKPPAPVKKRSISMHEDVPVWDDCCSCEAEPYWQELAGAQEDREHPPIARKNNRQT